MQELGGLQKPAKKAEHIVSIRVTSALVVLDSSIDIDSLRIHDADSCDMWVS